MMNSDTTMNDILEKLNKTMASVSLTEDERSLMKTNIVRHMMQPTAAPHWAWKDVFSRIELSQVAAGAFMSAVLFVGGGVSFAAEKALPGDSLYSFKTGFNEAIIELLAVSDEGKARVQSQLAGKRLVEAGQLASQRTLSPEKKQVISAKFKEHVEEAERRIDQLVADNNLVAAVDASTELETSLTAHKEALAALVVGQTAASSSAASDDVALMAVVTEPVDETSALVAEVVAEVGEKESEATTARIDAEASVAAAVSSDTELKTVAAESRDDVVVERDLVRRHLNKEAKKLGDAATADLRALFDEALESLEDGDSDFDREKYENAVTHYGEASRMLSLVDQKIETLLLIPAPEIVQPVEPVVDDAASSTVEAEASTTAEL